MLIEDEQRKEIERLISALPLGAQWRGRVESHDFLVHRICYDNMHAARPQFLVACATCTELIRESTGNAVENMAMHLAHREHNPRDTSTAEFLYQLLNKLEPLVPPRTPRTVDGIVTAIQELHNRAKSHSESDLKTAFDLGQLRSRVEDIHKLLIVHIKKRNPTRALLVRGQFVALEEKDRGDEHRPELATIEEMIEALAFDVDLLQAANDHLLRRDAPSVSGPIPMRLNCPECGELHIDEGEFATRSHATHACQACGMVWRPAIVATVGVHFLPGFKNS